MESLLVIDTNGILHAISQRNEKLKLSGTILRHMVLRNVAAITSGYLIEPIIKDLDSGFRFLFVSDSKPYWREESLRLLGVNYKSKRQRKPEYENALTEITRYFYEALSLQGLHSMQMKVNPALLDATELKGHRNLGYEADDIAAGIAVKYHDKFRQIVFLTDDTDWLPFTQYENITWMGINPRTPRVRDAKTAIAWAKNASMFNATKAKKLFTQEKLNEPTDIWKFKAIFGDTSDNIPSSTDFSYISHISLFDPLFKCWEQSLFDGWFSLGVSPIRDILSGSRIRVGMENVPLIMQPLTP